MEYPYQIVTFLSTEPRVGQSIYGDKDSGGWLPQIALKRRFCLHGISETELLTQLEDFCAGYDAFAIRSLALTRLADMPVDSIPLEEPSAASAFHRDVIAHLGGAIVSKYSDREGDNFRPHITAEFWGRRVIDVADYEGLLLPIDRIWVVKDDTVAGQVDVDSPTRALQPFDLRGAE